MLLIIWLMQTVLLDGIYALYTDGRHRVSFDQVVEVMLETGNDLPSVYKETSEGGLAKHLD